MTAQIRNLVECALSWHRQGRQVAIATVVETWGSAPRRPGSQLVIDQDGRIEGSVSGGCVEAAVIIEAIEAIAEGAQRLLEYGVSDGDAFAVGLACGGTIKILVEPVETVLPIALLEQWVEAANNARPIGYVTDIQDGGSYLVGADAYPARFQLDQSGLEEDGRTFVAIHNPPVRLIIVGAVHIAQPLVAMAQHCGFAPTVIDPRAAFATAERFPDIPLSLDWPDQALRELRLATRCAVVTLTHDPKIDDPAITAALDSPAFYIGCLGSKRTHAGRVQRLTEAGYSKENIARIHGPVGLDLGGRQPQEIALSILAQVTQVLRKGAVR
ncbi:XdhC family protein [Loktanella sp. S4079]|uniref:XdhC family protein n=1 Tax=Loktanella sp. S4079 TaxID=579483 RepID=UPI0005FA123A|nr:XdhC/CoxI family protein [Loktanella sp. S4079]KJZ19904.1 XdhC/CoxI family protein [Loktanella sp. S4079]